MALKPLKQPGWPAPEQAMDAGRQFLRDAARAPGAVIAPHTDVDGLSSGALVLRTLQALDAPSPRVMVPGKAEHAHSKAFQARMRRAKPSSLVVVDMGSRGAPILRDVPTLVVDHHRPDGTPPGALMVSAYGTEPTPSTSLLTYFLIAPLVDQPELEWLALMGVVGDLGTDAPFPGMKDALKRHGRVAITDTVALLNAARRAARFDAQLAFDVLTRAGSPNDIVRGRVEGVDKLRALREGVQQEVTRCARVAPRFAGRVALLTIDSGAQIHPLLAVRWAQRLPEQIVMVANTGYREGMVHFALRSKSEADLIGFLRSLPLPPLTGDFAQGHKRATGGVLPAEEFALVLRALGFEGQEAEGAHAPA
jgi:single-stranded DNA-specific DHH superfamily exonuclease